MKKIYVNFDEENYINIFSENDIFLTEAYMEDDFEFSFGYSKVKQEDGLYYLYNSSSPKEQYISKDDSYKNELINSIEEYKHKLNQSDYIIVKIAELQILGENTSSLISKYSEELLNRKSYRQKINELEELLEAL